MFNGFLKQNEFHSADLFLTVCSHDYVGMWKCRHSRNVHFLWTPTNKEKHIFMGSHFLIKSILENIIDPHIQCQTATTV